MFLTFDDGPVPEVTDFVLECLSAHKALATFFCVGENVARHPQIFRKVIAGGHSVGNHTHNHVNGWKTSLADYVENIGLCADTLGHHTDAAPPSALFRPPYGRMTRKQIEAVNGKYNIIMWDVLSGDFDKNLSREQCLAKTLKYTGNGSIVIFHDSYKAADNLQYALPRLLDHLISKGYLFQPL